MFKNFILFLYAWFPKITYVIFLDLPAEVDNYHKLCPLEPPMGDNPMKSSTFGYVTSVYKAANIKTGIYYCLRRIHGKFYILLCF